MNDLLPDMLYLYFLLVWHLVLHQRLPDVIGCRVGFGSWGGLFVEVQLGHQWVTVYGRMAAF